MTRSDFAQFDRDFIEPMRESLRELQEVLRAIPASETPAEWALLEMRIRCALEAYDAS